MTPAFRLPALVVAGLASILLADAQEWIAEQILGSEYVIFDAGGGVSHVMFYEHPAKYNAVVNAFLT